LPAGRQALHKTPSVKMPSRRPAAAGPPRRGGVKQGSSIIGKQKTIIRNFGDLLV